MDDFIRKISQENWITVYLQDNPENAYDNFLGIFYSYYNSCFSVKAKTTKSNRPRKDWCTLDIVKSCKTKCKLYEMFIRKPTSVNKQNYITFRNKLHQTIINAKQTYYFNIFTKSNIKKTWSYINSILKGDKNKHFPSQILINDKLITNSKDICDCFNSYFTNLGTNLTKGIPSSTNPLNNVNFLHHSVFFTPTNHFEIEKIINNLKITSPGYDDIHPKIIKQISMIIAMPLSHIINCSLISGIVPSKLKIAKVIPIFKNGHRDDMYNYRPISVLPCFSKILEKIIANRLLSFLLKYNILYDHQFGFIPGKNTTHAILSLVDYLINSFEDNKLTCGIFLDISKAFDTIDHNILLSKLYKYGIRGNTLNWFMNYLSNRYQFVSINNTSSSFLRTECGVPQGSILGPILFILYINDLPRVSTKLKFLLYADDTNILYENTDANAIIKTINMEMPKIMEWFESNKLHLNVNKSVAMLFHTRQKRVNIDDISIVIDGKTIPFTTNTKFLGINIDNNLTWKAHINHITTKISKGVGVLSRLSKELPYNELILIYNTILLPYLTYCCITWGFTYQTYINKILIIQKKAMRIITHSPFQCHSSPLFKKTNNLNIFQIIEYYASIFMYQELNSTVPNVFQQNRFLSYSYHTYETRNKISIRTPLFKLQFSKRSIFDHGIKIWNNLSPEVKSITNKRIFKKMIRKKLINEK